MATPEEMQASMIANLEKKTGKGLDQWISVVRESGLEKHGELVKMLKSDHGMTHGYANMVVHRARSSSADAKDDDDLVEAQYAKKPALRPIYDAIVAKVRAFGDDVELAPKKSYVSLRRSKQFGIVQPSTKTRVDVGIQLKGDEPRGRLTAAGSSMSMVSHRVAVNDVSEVDEELIGWLREAWERA